MKKPKEKINPTLKRRLIKTLAQALSDLKSEKQALAFIEDFLTDAESDALAKRLAVAYWLKKGRTYANIKNNLKVSSSTIAEVSLAMKRKGFSTILKKIEAEEWANRWAKKIKNLMS